MSDSVQVDFRVRVSTEYVYPLKTDPVTAQRITSGEMDDGELQSLLADAHPRRYWLDEEADFDSAEII